MSRYFEMISPLNDCVEEFVHSLLFNLCEDAIIDSFIGTLLSCIVLEGFEHLANS